MFRWLKPWDETLKFESLNLFENFEDGVLKKKKKLNMVNLKSNRFRKSRRERGNFDSPLLCSLDKRFHYYYSVEIKAKE